MTTRNQYIIQTVGSRVAKEEQDLISRWRQAVGSCKAKMGIPNDRLNEMPFSYENSKRMERCLIENYLEPKGWDYFGKRDILYMDMIPEGQVAHHLTGYNRQA